MSHVNKLMTSKGTCILGTILLCLVFACDPKVPPTMLDVRNARPTPAFSSTATAAVIPPATAMITPSATPSPSVTAPASPVTIVPDSPTSNATILSPTPTVLPIATPTPPSKSPETDREVLVAFFDATDGERWENNWNWLSESPLGEWYGVTTNDKGRVIELDVSSNGLLGEIPAELGSLTNLRRLSLLGNQLTGNIPPGLGNLSSLVTLYVSDNQLSGAIPPELGNLSELFTLSLDRNQLSGEIPSELGSLSELGHLSLFGNQLVGKIPPALGGLSRLEEVRLGGGNQFAGCIPDRFRNLVGDYAELGLPFCEPIIGPVPFTIGGTPLPEKWDGTPGIKGTGSSAVMSALGANGLRGTLHLIQVGRYMKVGITLYDAGPGPYAAAIRRGGCPVEGEPPGGQFDYLLFDAEDGESLSIVNTPAEYFQYSLAYVIVVDSRALPTDPPISCGNIPSLLR